jgi:hypothetical protein
MTPKKIKASEFSPTMDDYVKLLKETQVASLQEMYDSSKDPYYVGVDTGAPGGDIKVVSGTMVDHTWAKEVEEELNSDRYKQEILDKTFTVVWDHYDSYGQLSDTNIHKPTDTRTNKLFSDREQFTGKELTMMLRASQKIREINVITEDGLLRVLKVIRTDSKLEVLLQAVPVDLPSRERNKLSQMMLDVIGKMPAEDLARIFPDMTSGSIIQELIKHKLD